MSFTYSLSPPNASAAIIVANKTNLCESQPLPPDLPHRDVGGPQCQLYYSGTPPLDSLRRCCLPDTGLNNLNGCLAWCRTDRNTSDWANCALGVMQNRTDPPTAWHARCGELYDKSGGAVYKPTSSASVAQQPLSRWSLFILLSVTYSITLLSGNVQ